MMPDGVDTTETPMPPTTVGISLTLTYLRSPGLLTRFIPVITGVFPS